MKFSNVAAVAAQYRKQKERDGGRRRGADAFKPVQREHRVERLRALGNAVYWRQFYPIFRGIMEIETWNTY